jgi:hypothetical protein
MNLIQITEQLKNPAVSVQQLMQYANNSNPQVPSYVALAEMQRRQSMQAPPQAPQQTVKDQLGAQLMGLPAAPGAPAPGAAPQQPPQQPQPQGMQPQGMQPPAQVPMPEPKQALPNQPPPPGMAGGGLTSLPLNMHHDFAAGGLIAFAGGGSSGDGETDLAAQYPEQTTLEQERARREELERIYNFGGDPYAEAKRRYSAIEQKQLEREKEAGSNRFWAGLAAYGSAGPKGFAQAAGNASQVMQGMEKQQQAEGDTQRAKMAELHTLWGKEQDALNRAKLASDEGKVNEKRELLQKAAKYRLDRQQAEAQTTSAGASAQNARTLEEQRKFEQANYPREMALKERVAGAQLAHATRPGEQEQRLKLYKENPAAYAAIYGEPKSGLTEKDVWEGLIKNDFRFGKLPLEEQIRQVREVMSGKKPSTTGKSNPYADKSDAELLKALGLK